MLTVGVLQAGTKENVIPDEALIKLNVRTFDEGVRKRVLAAIERIVNAEAAASGAPRPTEITPLDRYPLNVNDKAASDRVAEAFRAHFSADRVRHTGPAPASEDFRMLSEPSGTLLGLLVRRRHRSARVRQGQSGRPHSATCPSTTARISPRCCTRRWKPAWKPWPAAALAWNRA